ncbi:hypothetical protein T484DRAFT_1841907, partial [Baffinella frigidus]
YNDTSPIVSVKTSVVVSASAEAELQVTPPTLAAGTPLSITVIDLDLNLDSGLVDSAQVAVTSSSPSEGAEVIRIVETSPASGTFTATLATFIGDALAAPNDASGTFTATLATFIGDAFAAPNDGAMDANAGDTFNVTYFERAPIASRTVRVRA